MSHFQPSAMTFFLYKFYFNDWIFHSAVICGPERCKGDGFEISFVVRINLI